MEGHNDLVKVTSLQTSVRLRILNHILNKKINKFEHLSREIGIPTL